MENKLESDHQVRALILVSVCPLAEMVEHKHCVAVSLHLKERDGIVNSVPQKGNCNIFCHGIGFYSPLFSDSGISLPGIPQTCGANRVSGGILGPKQATVHWKGLTAGTQSALQVQKFGTKLPLALKQLSDGYS